MSDLDETIFMGAATILANMLDRKGSLGQKMNAALEMSRLLWERTVNPEVEGKDG